MAAAAQFDLECENDLDFAQRVAGAGSKLIIVQLGASWCGPCKDFGPTFQALSEKYDNAVFIKVDVEKCEGVGAKFGVQKMPTFVLLKDKTKLESMEGANKAELEAKITRYYKDANKDDSGVKGMMDLDTLLDKSLCECLNQADDHPYEHAISDGGGFLESDCDEQLILSLAFNQAVKVHSIKVKAPQDKGPKNIRIFMNQPNTLDFDKADSMIATQDLTLTPGQLDGSPITLKFVKFQNVQNLQFFIKDNQGGDEVTQIDYFGVVGMPIGTTNMNEFKRIAGKKGEGH